MSKRDRIIGQLRMIPALRAADDYELSRIAQHVVEEDAVEHTVLVAEGQTPRYVYLLLRGRATVSVEGRDVAEIGPGSVIGEMGMLAHVPHSATVTVVEPAQLMRLDWQGFASLLDAPAAARGIAIDLSERLRATQHATS